MVTDFFRDQRASKQHLEEAFLKQEHGYENSSCFFLRFLRETVIHVRKHAYRELIMLLGGRGGKSGLAEMYGSLSPSVHCLSRFHVIHLIYGKNLCAKKMK